MAIKNSKSTILAELDRSKNFGLRLITEFHNSNRRFSNYKLTLDQLIKTLEARPNQKRFLSILGSVIDSGTSESDAIQSMRNLASKSKGRIPSSNADFKQAIIDKSTEFSFVDAVSYTIVESTKQVVEGVESVGNTLITTGKIINLLFPIAVIYFAWIYLNKRIA